MPISRRRSPRSGSFRGQSFVEFALVLPLLLTFLVMTIDAGRLYFGWVSLINASRVGANYAADHPKWTSDDRTDYASLINGDAADAAARNCTMGPPAEPKFTRNRVVVTDPQLGDYAEVKLSCTFSLITPLAEVIGAGPISLNATSTFPVRDGCASCPPPPPAPEPQPPAYCRQVPTMAGLSVAGARLSWQSAGFSPTKFTPSTGSDTRTVQAVSVSENDPTSNCNTWTPGTWAIFSSSVIATLVPPDSVDPSCRTVPNLKGRTVANARSSWSAAGFTGSFAPPDQNALVVTNQATSPAASTPGVSCIPRTSTVTVTTGPAWPAPPAAPCRVPNFTGIKKNNAGGLWTGAGFGATHIAYDGNGNFTITRQSLVGGDWVDCGSSITVYQNP
ncbi:MAG: pilus assembly protein [Chloroflexota bacterium]|nr:pilus assembly protein [Chloroflexota bacterium]